MSENDERSWARDVDAFDDCYRENVRLVYSYAASRLGRTEAEDITADVFHAAVVAYRSGRAGEVTTPWLIAVTRNKVIDHWRKAERRMLKAHLLDSDDVAFPDEWHADDRRELVVEALQRLSARHRMLLMLHHVEGMRLAAIADEIGETRGAVESALARARTAFRKKYAETMALRGGVSK